MSAPIYLLPFLSTIGSFFAKFLTDSLLKFVAYKMLYFTLLTVTLPIVIKNLITWLFNTLSSFVDDVDLGDLDSVILQLTGLSAYLAQHLNLVDAITILLTATAIRFTLNLIPGIG